MAGDDLKPTVFLSVSGTELGEGALAFVSSVRVELSLDKADLITMTVENPIKDVVGEIRTSELLWTNSLAWMPGNTLEVGFSYGDAEPPVIFGGISKKWMPRFPRTGMPKIVVKAMDGAVLMMDGPKSTDARTFGEETTLSGMAIEVLSDYGFDVSDVGFSDAIPDVVTIKKAGMSDYVFVRGITNLLGWEFYIRWDSEGQRWAAVMREPVVDDSDPKRFTWGPDFEVGLAGGVLLEFNPEMATQNVSTDIEVYYFDRDTLTWEKIIYPEEEPDRTSDKAEFEWKGDETTVEADLEAVGDPETARGLRIKAGGVSVEVVPTHGFKDAETAYNFAKSWWQSRQSLLIQGKGRIIGFPGLLPGQVHELGGLGPGLDGEWYFSEVTHSYRRGGPYECEFVARKVIP